MACDVASRVWPGGSLTRCSDVAPQRIDPERPSVCHLPGTRSRLGGARQVEVFGSQPGEADGGGEE